MVVDAECARLPGPSPSSLPQFKSDERSGEKEKNQVSQFAERNNDKQYFGTQDVNDQHWLVGSDLMVCQEAGDKRQNSQ